MFADTPKPPYYTVIFTSVKSDQQQGYSDMATNMWNLAHQQPGFLGAESASADLSITVSYWKDLDSIKAWRNNAEHQQAQKMGKEQWYNAYKLRIAKVERDYQFARL
ncbi:antibiotic biosynthesis monooxygenase family protein [Neptunicella marina]|uniref:Antibiotic biosynthesis monooxygenase n=1 Tax=Neptunicella marina TaxID=2125989 RepID=A0A8J6M2T6_9ALTE|nr:antibiotic biosynthesis monooxygenase [Neptunicella marina]MBC3766492.1 antibiotic biosynthesis monooxygenase [Neptunicella marina]